MYGKLSLLLVSILSHYTDAKLTPYCDKYDKWGAVDHYPYSYPGKYYRINLTGITR